MRRKILVASLLLIAVAVIAMVWINRRPMVVERANLGGPPPQIRAPRTLIGQLAPSFAGLDQDGREVSAPALRGRVVVLSVWASWCQPCLRELPRLEREVYQRFQPQAVVVGVGLGEGHAKVVDFNRRASLTFPLLADPNRKIARRFGADHAIPQTFVIDRSGVIVYQTFGYDERNFDHLAAAAERAIARR
ncbi:MAG TPA: peroxiredoxin family protein [Thermoanaerobaculia bacterium]|nr:peroxiredoxin family protein [Thermoanaerobaculia bacterium]